jgi:hypothetical protein
MEYVKHLKSTYVLVVFLSGTLMYCRVYFKIKIYFTSYTVSQYVLYILQRPHFRRSWDKNLVSFPPCYSQSPLSSTNGFYPPPPSPSQSWLKLVCKVNIVYGNLKSEHSQENAQKPQRNCTFMNSASELYSTVQMLLRCRLLDLGATWEGLTAGVFKALIHCLFYQYLMSMYRHL